MPKSISKIISSTLVLVLLGILFVFTLTAEIKEWQKRRSIDNEISRLTNQSNTLEQKNQEIANSLQFLNSPDFKEKIAREELNLKLDGESVYNVPDNPKIAETPSSATTGGAPATDAQKWYAYFFQKN